MESAILPVITQLGVAAFAIWIMYQMYIKADSRMAEKDEAFSAQVEKHENTLLGHQTYMREIHSNTVAALAHSNKVIEDNVKAYERVIHVLDKQK
ncbi:MAG: hypothetical protein C0429_09740 [Sphingopyxis sp.]|nr:hypothetical protein [Sphingopyxis sp.]